MQSHMEAGFNLSCVGDNRGYSMVETPYGDTLADKALKSILKFKGGGSIWPYLNRGSDERQYCSPGAGLPVVSFCRSKFGTYPEYHTSADNMELVSPEGFQGSYEVVTELVDALEQNGRYRVTVIGEPQLGKRGLFPATSKKGAYDGVMDLANFIAYADGSNDLFDISSKIGVPARQLIPVVETLASHALINKIKK